MTLWLQVYLGGMVPWALLFGAYWGSTQDDDDSPVRMLVAAVLWPVLVVFLIGSVIGMCVKK